MSINIWPDVGAHGYALAIAPVEGTDYVCIVGRDGGRVSDPWVCRADGTAAVGGANRAALTAMGIAHDNGRVYTDDMARIREAFDRKGKPKAEGRGLFTRRHYRAVANTLRQAFLDEYARRSEDKDAHVNTETVGAIVRRMATAFEADNPRFVRAMFYAEAGCCEDGTPDYSISDDNPDNPAKPEGV